MHDSDQSAMLLGCRHLRVTRNSFRLQRRAVPRHRENWVYLIGAHSGNNRIDHNRFEHKANLGCYVFIRGDDAALVGSQHDRIDHNYFRDVAYGGGARRLRDDPHRQQRSRRTPGEARSPRIEQNFLEQCGGEEEVVSLKSSDNVVRHNTLVNCRGGICLRLGNRDEVSGNFVLATDGRPGHGGVKLYGYDHRVFNNYFLGLTGAAARSVPGPGPRHAQRAPPPTRSASSTTTLRPSRRLGRGSLSTRGSTAHR